MNARQPEVLDPSNSAEDEDIGGSRASRRRSAEFERKRRHAEAILESRRLSDMLGFDVDFPDD